MIVISLLLIAVAVVLLAAGLWQPSGALLGGSIAASLLAAISLVAGARRAAAADEESGDDGGSPGEARHSAPSTGPRHEEPTASAAEHRPAHGPAGYPPQASGPLEPVTAVIPVQSGTDGAEPEYGDVDPPDEPAPQQVSAADAARVAQMSVEVLVVDGRPRYHLAGCVHLLGREYEPLPVAEAIELGFTPCGLCEPDSALLADARRV